MQFESHREEDVLRYHERNPLAPVGLILGAASFSVFFSLAWLAIPVLGVAISLVALRHIYRSDGEQTGLKAAVAGLFLSLLFGTAGPARVLYYRSTLDEQSQQFVMLWFDLVAKGRLEKAVLLELPPTSRPRLDQDVSDYYRAYPDERERLETLRNPAAFTDPKFEVIPKLLSCIDHADIRCYRTIERPLSDETNFAVEQVYSVAYKEGGEHKTFYIDFNVARSVYINNVSDWQIVYYKLMANPDLSYEQDSYRKTVQ